MIENKLLNLDFTPGIHDDDINYNFAVVKDWIDRERLRMGGWGIVEGFDLIKDLTNFTITIGQGTLINEQGEEIIVPQHTEPVGAPVFSKYRESVTIAGNGTATLKFPVYSNVLKAQVLYVPPEHMNAPEKSELTITEQETKASVPYLTIINNIISVNAEDWSNATVDIDYLYSNDRIDAIFIAKDGSHYLYQKGLISTSPSSPDITEYQQDYYLIGFAYWHIGTTVDVEFITVDRALRKIYVDKDNVLWLNGKRFTESKYIYFVQPASPVKDDIWYDEDTNTLYIWKEKDGSFGWIPINDQSDSPVRSTYLWTIDHMPDDLQTFLFNKDTQPDLFFTPEMNSLDIYIDNAPLMSDQFTEIIQKGTYSYEDTGIGFKLIEPLDRATPVQVTVTRAIRSTPQRETFQRMAIFTEENYQSYFAGNTNCLFYTDPADKEKSQIVYEIGEQQLEVWLDGKRLTRKLQFDEVTKDNHTVATASDKGMLSNAFILYPNACNLTAGSIVTYKITRHMWSYENLQKVVDTIEQNSTYAKNAIGTLPVGATDLQSEIDTLTINTNKQLSDVNTSIANIASEQPDMTAYVKKTDQINKSQLTAIASGLFLHTIHLVQSATPIITIPCKTTDYINVTYVTSDKRIPLLIDLDYSLSASGDNVLLKLNSDYTSSAANIYIDGIVFGG